MRRKNTALLLILPLMSVLLVPGCATLTRKSTQRIPVTSVPVGATVIVNGVEQGVTPLVIWPDRKWKDQVIRIESPGYNPVEIKLKRSLSEGPIFGNFFIGAMFGVVPGTIIGLWFLNIDKWTEANFTLIWALCAAAFDGAFTAVDIGNGSGYSLSPTDMMVTLTKADGAPRVDTMLIDADDFRNVKWIRVRRD